MRLLVTGAHGFVGRALLGGSWQGGIELSGCGRRDEPVGARPYVQVDLADPVATLALLRAQAPDWVIHTAALTDVDRCEREPGVSEQVNCGLVAHLVSACQEVGCGLVQLSTDYVFDGEAGPYAETAATNPLSVYARHKLISEELVLSASIEALVVRTLWLYGHIPGARLNLVTWPLKSLVRGEELRIVNDQWGNPTYVHDLARALVELCAAAATGLFHFGGADFCTRQELVQQVARRFSLDIRQIHPITTADAGQSAPRPLRSGLISERVKSKLGWSARTLDEGLCSMAAEESFQSNFRILT